MDHTGIFILYVRHNEYIYACINLMEAFWCLTLDKQGHSLQTLTLLRSSASTISVSWDAHITEENIYIFFFSHRPALWIYTGANKLCMIMHETQSSGHFTSRVLDLFWPVIPFKDTKIPYYFDLMPTRALNPVSHK